MGSITETLTKRENVTRILTTLILLCFFVPYLVPIGIPVTISNYTREYLDVMNSLQPGDIVLMDQNWAGYGERTAGTLVTLRHLFALQDVRFVIISCDAPGMSQLTSDVLLTKTLQPEIQATGKVYGVDYVYLGFLPGWEPMIAGMATNVLGLYQNDYWGAPTADMPIFQDVEYKNTGRRGFIDYNDIDLIVNIEGKHTSRYFIYQWNIPYGTPNITHATMKDIIEYVMYYPHSLQAMLWGSRGGAELELLTGRLGPGIASMDAMSTVSVLSIIFLIIGNIQFLYGKQRGVKDQWARDEVFADSTYESPAGTEA
jgi:hypothetical protein